MFTRPRPPRCFFALCAVWLGGSAWAAPPTVEVVAPAVGQRGTEFTLTLTGARLADPRELMLYAPGVVCTKLTAANENEVTATLKAAPDCRPGEYPFRLRTPGGASELRTFRVTATPVVAEQEPNDDPATAQAVPLGVAVAGAVENGGADCFAVTLKKGQRLAAEVEAVRLGAEFTDTTLTVLGPDGKELAAADDTPLTRQDPFLTVVVPADGVYVVRVREAGGGGGDASRYVLHLGTFCRPAAVFPAGGQAGTEVKVALLGDAAGSQTQSVRLPATGAPFDFYPTDAGGAAPTPNPFRVSPFPNVLEAEPNDDPKQVRTAAAWPVAFNGVIGSPGDTDHFRFRAAAGDVIDVHAFAHRLGSPLDTVVSVLDADGNLVSQNDDDETHDSRLQVTIRADGEYVVRVRDKRKQGGPHFVYRVELDRPKPGLAVSLAAPGRKTQDRQVVAVPRGNRTLAFLAVRRDGCDGPVAVSTGPLPKGVAAKAGTVAEGEYLLPVVFEAAADAPLGGALVEVSATGGDPKGLVTGGFSQAVTLSAGPGDAAFHAVTLTKLAVVVVGAAPYSATIEAPAVPAPVDGVLDVVVRVTRAKDFAEPLAVTFPSLPPGVEAPTSVIVPAEQSEVVVPLVVHPSAEPGDWRLGVEVRVAPPGRSGRDPLSVGMNGLGTGGGRRPRKAVEGLPTVSSGLVAAKVAAAPVAGRFAPVAAEQGKTITVVCALDAGLPGEFTATLAGLPPRAATPAVVMKPGAKQIEFAITVDPTTPPGEHPTLVCELVREVGGRKVVYRLGRGGVLTVSAPGAVKTDAAGKPLSPLDALRLEQRKP
jgi:hypothetical protein